MDIQSSGSAGDDNRRNEMMEPQSPRDRQDIFDRMLNLSISKVSDHQYNYYEVQTERRYKKRHDFKHILNSSSSNERLIPLSPNKGSSRENSERVRNAFQTQNSMGEEEFRKNFKRREEQSFSIQNTIRDSSSSFSERSDSKSFKQILPPQIREQQSMEAQQKKLGCNCKRSKCLKLYCQCFQKQLFCNQNCNCHDCGNHAENQAQHKQAVIEALGRNAHGFQQQKRSQIKQFHQRQGFSLGVELQEVKKGCKCRKTHCIKKYCQCYHNGIGCGIFCRCEDCFNTEYHRNKN